jgi:hypothetical protein
LALALHLQAPTLSFIGIPWKVVPFPQFELQSKWVAQLLSRRVDLPPQEEMERAVLQVRRCWRQSVLHLCTNCRWWQTFDVLQRAGRVTRSEAVLRAIRAAGLWQFEATLEPKGPKPRRHAHCLGDDQFAYNDRLADICGVPRLPGW